MQKRAAQSISFLAFLLVTTLGISTKAQKGLPQSNVPNLPLPSGPYGVGRASFDWIDPNRVADMAEDRGPNSELMVYLWYPTEAAIKEVKGILLPGAKEIDSAPGISDSLKSKL